MVLKMRTNVHAERVESAANPSDGGSRGREELYRRLGAVFREPRLPVWLQNIWSPLDPSHDGFGLL